MPHRARPHAEFDRRLGIPALDTATIVAIAAVLVLVSLPRLRSFAATANEEDALGTSIQLAKALSDSELTQRAMPRLADIAQAHLRELSNAEFLDGGRRMRRNGYLFSLVRVPRPPARNALHTVLAMDSTPLLAIVAWPWEVGRTGRSAWLATSAGDLMALRCKEGSFAPGSWNGPVGQPLATDSPKDWSWDGWRSLH